MQKTLGGFVSREEFSSAEAYNRKIWRLLETGPAIVQPRRCGSFEPLRPVDDVDLGAMFKEGFYITSNGRRCLCMIFPDQWGHDRYHSTTIILTLKSDEGDLAREVYDWFRGNCQHQITYMGTPTDEMMADNLELHQILNRGVAEVDLPKVRKWKNRLDCFDEVDCET
jgi:hypothetical protein